MAFRPQTVSARILQLILHGYFTGQAVNFVRNLAVKSHPEVEFLEAPPPPTSFCRLVRGSTTVEAWEQVGGSLPGTWLASVLTDWNKT